MKFLRFWFPPLALAVLIFCLSSVPGNDLPRFAWARDFLPVWLFNHLDKLVHGMLYAALGWLALRAMALASSLPFPRGAVVAFLICSFYGASDEWHQSFVPRRSCDFFDWMADSVGAAIAIVGLYRPYEKRSKYRPVNIRPLP